MIAKAPSVWTFGIFGMLACVVASALVAADSPRVGRNLSWWRSAARERLHPSTSSDPYRYISVAHSDTEVYDADALE